MSKSSYDKSLEWELGCIGSSRIAFKPHRAFLTTQRERYIVVYPLSSMIIAGTLEKNQHFQSFGKDKMVVFCNMRLSIDLRLDFLAISAKGDVLILEGKLRREQNEGNALKKLGEAAKQLADYREKLELFAKSIGNSPYEIWADRYNNSFTNKFAFPSFYMFVKNFLSIDKLDAQKEFFLKVNKNILNGKVKWGLAFNELEDFQDCPDIDRSDYSLPIKDTCNPGYGLIDKASIITSAYSRWSYKQDRLFLFAVDHLRRSVKIY
jgi:hypothetical protein